VPVVSAVGHESDVLVSDLVADLRASTPSDAIERVVPSRNEMEFFLDEMDERLKVASRRQLIDCRQKITVLHSRLRVAPLAGLNRAKGEMMRIASRIERAARQTLSVHSNTLARYEASLAAVHPQRVLERGYSMTQTAEGAVLSSVEGLQSGQDIILHFADGSADAQILKTQKIEGTK
jgi:exodeoxyribonuclease VII large subunit